jgi:hypothetical protein
MERAVVHLYVKSFIINWFLHDVRGDGFNVINRPTNVVVELSTIVKICKYRGLMKGTTLL